MAHAHNIHRAFPSIPGRTVSALFLSTLALTLGLFFNAPSRAATEFPARTVQLIVPFAAGGPTDVFARKLADVLKTRWKNPIIIDNKPGAGNVIGIQAAVNARPDGYTLIIVPDPAVTVDPLIRSQLPYDPQRDLVPITTLVTYPQVIVANASLPAKSLKELADLSKKMPINYGSYGLGTAPHLVLELFKQLSGAEMTQIPYKGSAPAWLALNANEVQLTVAGVGTAMPYVESGRARILAIEGDERFVQLPDVPTFAEAGYPKLRAPAWWGLFAPKGIDPELVKKITIDVDAALQSNEMRPMLEKFGYKAGRPGAAILEQNIQEIKDLWEPVVKSQHIKIN